jgi:hypothetical protein
MSTLRRFAMFSLVLSAPPVVRAADEPAEETPAAEPTSSGAEPSAAAKNPHTAAVSGNVITLTFRPGDSSYASSCAEIQHVQVLRMNADDVMILPSKLKKSPTNTELDATASDSGWVIDSVRSPSAPYYQGAGDSGIGSIPPAKNAVLEDSPILGITPDFPPFDAEAAPTGWKVMFWQFKSFAVCSAGPQCGTWYEGVGWTYTQTAEDARAGKAGSSKVLQAMLSPSPAGSDAHQAFERYAAAKGFTECK